MVIWLPVLGCFDCYSFYFYATGCFDLVLLSRFIEVIRDSKVVKAMLQGIRAAVIGMIFASAITIGNTMPLEIRTIGLFLINFGISYKYNLNPIFLILGSGLIGLILFAI